MNGWGGFLDRELRELVECEVMWMGMVRDDGGEL